MKNLLLCLAFLAGTSLHAQYDFFESYVPKAADAVGKEHRIVPDQASIYAVTTPSDLAKVIGRAPMDGEVTNGEEVLLNLPSPDGNVSTFRITRYQIITDELQAVYPHYITAFGWDVEAPHRKIFLEWTDLGFGASVTGGEEGRWYIAPLFWQQQDLYQSYYTRDYPEPTDGGHCGFEADQNLLDEIDALGPPTKSVGDCRLREYDLALACTGEYYAAVGGTEALVIAEMMTAINRVNEVFRADLAIQINIINLPTPANGVQLLYTNPASDPYTNNDGLLMLGENQVEVDNVIGTANYDIGHVFSTGGGGIAALGSPCSSSSKAQGVTGSPSPTGDPFYIDLVAHEIGHQFGGNHTFNSTNGNCTARNSGTAYEPGTGTTIQAYAGICGAAANVQSNSDPYYHAISIQEISAYMELGGGASCADVTSTANGAPTVGAGSDFTIPANTPFVLTATGSDPNGDALTYCWEQFDLGPVVAAGPTGNEINSPLFRSLPPVTSTDRYFPNLPALVAGTATTWEVLPKVARNMTFIVTLRDFGAAGYGCTIQEEMDITVVASTGFAVTAPNGGETWSSGSMQTVTWNVAGTGNGTAVDCEMVDIVLSTDGGVTFDQVLATVANTGTTTLMAPSVTETNARIMIRCNGNIFFDVGNADFSIEQTDYDYTTTTAATTICNSVTTADFSFNLESLQGYTGTVNYSATNLPAGATISFSPASTTLTNGEMQMVTATVSNLGGLASGDYTFQIVTNDGGTPKSEDYTLTVLPGISATTLLTPTAGGFLDRQAAAFDWSIVPNANEYDFQLCNNANGTNCFNIVTTTNSSLNFGDNFAGFFNDGDVVFWQVTAKNTDCSPDDEVATGFQQFTWGTMPPTGNSLNASAPIGICEGSTTEEAFTVSFFNADLTGPATLSVLTEPAGVTATLSMTTLNNTESTTVSFIGEESLAAGDHVITIQANDGTGTEDIDLTITIVEDGVPLNAPVDGGQVMISPDGNGRIPLNFNSVPGASTYTTTVTFPSGATADLVVSAGGTNTINIGAVNNGDVFVIVVTANTGEESCPVTFTFLDVVLPVDWLSFTAIPLGKTSQLAWSVIQDAAHNNFTIERSMGGQTAWADIASLDRIGPDGTANYSYSDINVLGGNTYFYRLRQQDLDGTTDYSAIRSVTFSGEATDVSAFPNPASDHLNVVVGTEAPANLDYQLYSPLGQLVSSGKLTVGNTAINLAELPTAVYQLVVTDASGFLKILRIVKR